MPNDDLDAAAERILVQLQRLRERYAVETTTFPYSSGACAVLRRKAAAVGAASRELSKAIPPPFVDGERPGA